MITIVDFGMGNLGSIRNMLKKIGAPAMIASSAPEIRTAEKLILPGVGAFDNAMSNLRDRGFIEVLNERVLNARVPVLGICLGMQLLSRRSEEGKLPGLGWIDADTVRFYLEPGSSLKIPHMGWSTVSYKEDCPLFSEMYSEPRFYFVHSYHVQCKDSNDVVARAHHGIEFTACLQRGNIFGAQFHPEKSHKFGLRLLTNFAERC